MVLFLSLSFSLLACFSGIACPEETKNQRGKCPPPDSDSFSDAQFDRNLACLSRPAYRKRGSPLQVPNTVSFSLARTTFAVITVCDCYPDRACSANSRPTRSPNSIRLC